MSKISKLKSLAVACPGQGIITRGCLSGVRKHQQIFQQTLDCVDLVFGEKVSRILLETPSSVPDPWSLSTANAQPAIVASTYVLVQILRDLHGIDLTSDHRVSFYLGHSLGEYTALLLSGVLTLPQALHVVRERGLMMEELVKERVYEMRVLVFRPSAYSHVYGVTSRRGVLACANNGSQILISGDPKVLDSVVAELNSPRKTILKQVTLPVTIPFHNEILGAIEPSLKELVKDKNPPTKPIISNYTGRVSEGDAYENTVRCNSVPVQWKTSMEFLETSGAEGIVSLGPGNAVDVINSKFSIANYPVKTVEDMASLVLLEPRE